MKINLQKVRFTQQILITGLTRDRLEVGRDNVALRLVDDMVMVEVADPNIRTPTRPPSTPRAEMVPVSLVQVLTPAAGLEWDPVHCSWSWVGADGPEAQVIDAPPASCPCIEAQALPEEVAPGPSEAQSTRTPTDPLTGLWRDEAQEAVDGKPSRDPADEAGPRRRGRPRKK